MAEQSQNLYAVQKKDIQKAGVVFADAFQNDPVWEKVLEGATTNQKRVFFMGPVRYCLKYGKLYASSEKLEGLAGWVPGNLADMTIWRGLRSGSMGSSMKVGMKTMMSMKPIFAPLEAARRATMSGREYIYLVIIGVSPEHQGQGHGTKLLKAVIEEGNATGLPIYLETTTAKNINMYKKFSFKQLQQVIHPIIDLPQWGMVREADA